MEHGATNQAPWMGVCISRTPAKPALMSSREFEARARSRVSLPAPLPHPLGHLIVDCVGSEATRTGPIRRVPCLVLERTSCPCIKSNDESEAEKLARFLRNRPREELGTIAFYGAERPVRRLLGLVPELREFTRTSVPARAIARTPARVPSQHARIR